MLARRQILLITLSGVLSVFCVAFLWEFGLEDLILNSGDISEWQEPASEKWEHIVGATVFSLVGMAAPMFLLLRRNAHIKSTFERLDKAQRTAQRNSESKSRFLAHMSHELRTPLNAILGFSQMIQGEFFGPLKQPKYKEYIHDIHASAEHLLDLINDVLSISRLEAGEIEINVSDINVRRLINSCVRLVEGAAAKKSIEIEVDAPESQPEFQADERFLKQILINLLTNAVKFTPEGGRVTVRAAPQDGHVLIAVEDTGIGIAAENLKAVLEPFGQARVSPEYAHDGVGLGLSLSKELTELHGGALTITSEVGVGTKVTLMFPRHVVTSGDS